MTTSGPMWFASSPLPEPVRRCVDSFPIEEMITTVLDRCTSTAFPQRAHDEEFVGRLLASVSQNAYALRDVLAGRAALDDVPIDKVLGFATVQAQQRIPQKAMQWSYRVSF